MQISAMEALEQLHYRYVRASSLASSSCKTTCTVHPSLVQYRLILLSSIQRAALAELLPRTRGIKTISFASPIVTYTPSITRRTTGRIKTTTFIYLPFGLDQPKQQNQLATPPSHNISRITSPQAPPPPWSSSSTSSGTRNPTASSGSDRKSVV